MDDADRRPDHLIPNLPPPEETARTELTDALAEFEARKAEIVASFSEQRLIVTDNASAGTTADKIAIAKTLLDDIDAARRRVKAPFDRAVKTVDGGATKFAEEVEQAIRRAEQKIREFRADARRRAREAAEAQAAEERRLAAEAGLETLAEPAAPIRDTDVQLPVARGDYGSKVHDGKVKTFEIEDVRQLPDEILKAPAVEKAMLAAIKQLARLRDTIPGVKIDFAATDTIRRAG
jgi:hypothetical protein